MGFSNSSDAAEFACVRAPAERGLFAAENRFINK